ncbi:hypothetical protein WJX79_010199 [Trebouxia sp. C0005]
MSSSIRSVVSPAGSGCSLRQVRRSRACRVCAQQQTFKLHRPVRAVQHKVREVADAQQPTEIAQATSLVLHPHATNQYTILQSNQEPHLSKGQRVRLQQWILRAVSSGAYSLSALLVAGAINPAVAVGEFNPGSGASVTASQPPSIPDIPNPASGITPFEGLLVFAPVLLYGLFTIYRSKVNERAKLSDFLFIVAAGVVVSNLLSIIFFKRKLY